MNWDRTKWTELKLWWTEWGRNGNEVEMNWIITELIKTWMNWNELKRNRNWTETLIWNWTEYVNWTDELKGENELDGTDYKLKWTELNRKDWTWTEGESEHELKLKRGLRWWWNWTEEFELNREAVTELDYNWTELIRNWTDLNELSWTTIELRSRTKLSWMKLIWIGDELMMNWAEMGLIWTRNWT